MWALTLCFLVFDGLAVFDNEHAVNCDVEILELLCAGPDHGKRSFRILVDEGNGLGTLGGVDVRALSRDKLIGVGKVVDVLCNGLGEERNLSVVS